MWQKVKNTFHLINALFSNIYYGFPASKLQVIGITGTDGKTTTVHLIHFTLKNAGEKVALISSVCAEIGTQKFETGFHVTTPDPWLLNKLIRQACKAGCRYIILEVTSHALDQNRIWGIKFHIGLITNVTHEHLDYHKTFLTYLKTKEKLLRNAVISVINRDDRSYKYINIQNLNKVVTYGKNKSADINPLIFPFKVNLPGEYNEYNALAAISVCTLLKISPKVIRLSLKGFKGVRGRFERIKNQFGLTIIIDFAHTPNAFAVLLSTIKPQVHGKLIHVFGAAGSRDRSKRPLMGEISAKYADYIVLTEEDYRTESPNEIINEIAGGCLKAGAKASALLPNQVISIKQSVFFTITDRQKAINFAIRLAKKGDWVVITGKGHEKSLARGNVEWPWDEKNAVIQALKRVS